MRDYPSNLTVAGENGPAQRQGEIASLTAELDATVRESASLITRLYELAGRLGISPPPSETADSLLSPPPGQLGDLRDVVARLRRENSSFIRVLEALETL